MSIDIKFFNIQVAKYSPKAKILMERIRCRSAELNACTYLFSFSKYIRNLYVLLRNALMRLFRLTTISEKSATQNLLHKDLTSNFTMPRDSLSLYQNYEIVHLIRQREFPEAITAKIDIL